MKNIYVNGKNVDGARKEQLNNCDCMRKKDGEN